MPVGQFGHQDGGHTQLHRQQHQPVHRHCAEEAQITSLASQIGRHREKVNIVHQRHQDGGGTFLLSLEPHHQGQTHQYQQPGKGVFDPHQIRGKAAVGVDGRELRKVHEVQHQPVEEDQSALEQKLMPPAYAGELLQGLGRPAPTQFFCDRWQLHLPVCLLFFVIFAVGFTSACYKS